VIDLSYAAAHRIGMLEKGVAPVHIRAVGPADGGPGPVMLVADSGSPFRPEPDNGDVEPRFVQVGAFSDRVAAERVRHGLQDLGFVEVRITTFPSASGAPLHRVRIGPLTSASAVRDVEDRLQQAAMADYRVVLD
jgi:rare lipoprotein A